MSDISNKTLAILIGIAIVISLVGILSVGRGGVVYLTGTATSGQGPVAFNATSEVSILVQDSINFGNGRVDSTANNATLDSESTSATGGSWTFSAQRINIDNDGTVNISINVSADGDNNAAGLIGGTSPLFQIKISQEEGTACVGSTKVTDYANGAVPNSTETPLTICSLLNFGPQTSDEINISSRMVVPSDTEAGARNATLTFSATQA